MRKLPKRETIYHIYNRGNHKELICFDLDDYAELYGLIQRYFGSKYFDLISFCIMPNHFHLLVIQKAGYKISKSMHMITYKHAKYINKKYGFKGHLFQGFYKYRTVLSSTYFNKLVQYIRDNPKELTVGSLFIQEQNDYLISYYNIILQTK